MTDTTQPFFCPHVPHTPTRCYRRDGPAVACGFHVVPNATTEKQERYCVECGLETDVIDGLR